MPGYCTKYRVVAGDPCFARCLSCHQQLPAEELDAQVHEDNCSGANPSVVSIAASHDTGNNMSSATKRFNPGTKAGTVYRSNIPFNAIEGQYPNAVSPSPVRQQRLLQPQQSLDPRMGHPISLVAHSKTRTPRPKSAHHALSSRTSRPN